MGPGDQRGRLAIANRRVQSGSRWKSHADSHGDANTDAYSYGNSDLNADSNTGETITDGEASANITAAETIVGNITN